VNKAEKLSKKTTILFVKAESGAKPVPYEGEREADAMAKWLKDNAVSTK